MTVLKGKVISYGSIKFQQVVTDDAAIRTTKYDAGGLIRSIYYGQIDAQKDSLSLYNVDNSSVQIQGQARINPTKSDTCHQSVDSRGYDIGDKICWSGVYESGDFYRITSSANRPGADEDIYMKSWQNIISFSEEEIPAGAGWHLERNSPIDRSILEKYQIAKYYPEKWWENPWGLASSLKEGSSEDKSGKNQTISIPKKFKIRSIDKIINFNPSTDALEIDTDSFGIDSSATFATGKNKKAVKKHLAKQDFDFLYDEKKGGLYFNENGADKGFGDGGIIAILKGAPDLSMDNIDFV